LNKVISTLSAIILGAVIMGLPLLVTTQMYQQEQHPVAPTGSERLSTDFKDEAKATQTYEKQEASRTGISGIILSNIPYAGLIITLGFIVALTVSFYVKRKTLSYT